MILDDRYGYPAFGRALHKDDLKPDHVKWDFFHHVTRTQPICIQYHRSKVDTYDPTELYITDMKGKLLKMINPTSSYTLPSITGDTGEQLYTEQFQFKLSQYPELDNYDQVQFILRVYYSNEVSPLGFIVRDYRCDPLEIAEKWPEHVFYEYTHDTNDPEWDTVFEQLRPWFTCFVPSTGMKQIQGGKYTVYQNQLQKSKRLYGATVDNALWDIGGKEGLPMYYIDALADATCLKKQRYDGRYYTRIGEDFEENGTSDKGREFRKLMLQHAENILQFKRGLVQCWPIPATYPHAVGQHLLSDGFQYIGGVNKMFNDVGELNSYIDSMNTYASGIGVAGQFIINDGWVVFMNGQNEGYELLTPVKVYPNMLQFTVLVANLTQPFVYSLNYDGTVAQSHMVVWGGVSGTEELKVSTVTFYGGGNYGNTCTVSKLFASTGNKTVRIFTDNSALSFYCARSFPQPAAPQPKITNMDMVNSNLSPNQYGFYLINHDFSAMGTLSLGFMKNAKNSMKFILFDRCAVTGIATGWASSLKVGTYKPFAQLESFIFENNALNSASVDGVLNEIHQHTNWRPGPRVIRLNGNSPAAPKTATSNAAWNIAVPGSLTSNGYTIYTD